jgi:nitrite reductase/ring-hydroxylating ferredoxin subunit
MPEGDALMAEVLVCKQGDMAEGGVRIVRADKVEIGVIRHSGKYYAYRNHCPHQGGPACEGMMMPQVKELIDENGVYHGKTFDRDDMHIVCPWHGYEFHLADGVHVADKRIKLQKFNVIERDGDVYVAV